MKRPQTRAEAPAQTREIRPALRGLVAGTALALAAMGVTRAAQGQEVAMVVANGFSYYGDLSYSADFPNFRYVNP